MPRPKPPKRSRPTGFRICAGTHVHSETHAIQPPPKGNYIVSAEGLCSSLKQMHIDASPECPPEAFSLIELEKERAGIFSSLKAYCAACGYSGYIDDAKRAGTSFREGVSLNTALCLASNVVGLDFNSLGRFCHILGLDGPPDSWDDVYQRKIWETLSTMIDEQLGKNRLEAHRSRGSDGGSPVQISIKADGTYQKRGKVARLNLQKRFRNAVRQTVSREATTALEIKEGTGRMRQAIWATLHHTIIQDPDNRHIYCPVNSWCLYKTDNPAAFTDKPHHLDPCFLALLEPIYSHYTQESVLQRMLPGYNTNINESFNSLLWSIIPKAKYHGKRRQESATMIALLVYQSGYKIIDSICETLHLPVKDNSNPLLRQTEARSYHKRRSDLIAAAKFDTRLKEALQKKQDAGYAAGVMDAGDTNTGAMALPDETKQPDSTLSNLDFVVVLHGPQHYIGRVKEVDSETREVCIEYMTQVSGSTSRFYWKEPGDVGYEEPSWEFPERILCTINVPAIVSGKSSRLMYEIFEGDVTKITKLVMEIKEAKKRLRALRSSK